MKPRRINEYERHRSRVIALALQLIERADEIDARRASEAWIVDALGPLEAAGDNPPSLATRLVTGCACNDKGGGARSEKM
jgi:hypothetical protein